MTFERVKYYLLILGLTLQVSFKVKATVKAKSKISQANKSAIFQLETTTYTLFRNFYGMTPQFVLPAEIQKAHGSTSKGPRVDRVYDRKQQKFFINRNILKFFDCTSISVAERLTLLKVYMAYGYTVSNLHDYINNYYPRLDDRKILYPLASLETISVSGEVIAVGKLQRPIKKILRKFKLVQKKCGIHPVSKRLAGYIQLYNAPKAKKVTTKYFKILGKVRKKLMKAGWLGPVVKPKMKVSKSLLLAQKNCRARFSKGRCGILPGKNQQTFRNSFFDKIFNLELAALALISSPKAYMRYFYK